MTNWKDDVPFSKHWLVYITVKMLVIATAIYLAARAAGYVWPERS